MRLIVAGLLMACASVAWAQPSVVDTRFEEVNALTIPAGLTGELCDLLFSADGSTAYVVDNCEDSGSAVRTAPVLRDLSGNVIGFGAFSLVFAEPSLDTGLQFAPDGQTFFVYETTERIGQYPPGGP